MKNINPAIIWGTRRITWMQVEQYCASAIGQFKGLGIKSGDRVAICAPTITEYMIVLFALWRMKAVACPVSMRWPAKAVGDYLSRINASLFLTTVQIKNNLPGISLRTLYLNEVVTFDARREFYEANQPWQPEMQQDATVIATSGSEGQPKAAVHTWANHHYSALGSQEIIPLNSSDRWLLSLPLYHVSGMAIVIRSFLAGSAVVIPQEDSLAETLLKRQITHVSLVTTQMQRLLESSDGIEALKSLKYILLGGSAIGAALIEKSLSLNLNVYVSYGLTEMSSQVATGKAGGGVKILPYRQMRISPAGEILVQGEVLFKGYIQAGRIHRPQQGPWFATGDLGHLDENNCLTVTGRRDHMFISGGENIQPEEIERVLLSLEGVNDVVVVAKQDDQFGARPVAFIKSIVISTDLLTAHCHKFLPSFKVPVAFYPWPKEIIEKGIKISRKEFAGYLNR